MEEIRNSTEELEQQVGLAIRRTRLLRNLDRETLARQAGISVSALKNLEGGSGTTMSTFVKVVRALGKTEWLGLLAPSVTINPLSMVNAPRERQRASGKKGKHGDEAGE